MVTPSLPPRPLSQGNWLQRRYHRWAVQRYARMPPALRAQAEAVDRFLYSRHGLWVWLGLAAAVAASTLGLSTTRMPLATALALSVAVWVALLLAALGAWLMPERFTGRRLVRGTALAVVGGYCGAIFGSLLAHLQAGNSLDAATLLPALWSATRVATPFLLLALLAVVLLLWGLAQIRQVQMAQALRAAQVAQERDAAALAATAARLQLLQAQIQPHFIFNTLAALQHWVDAGDARAGPLLRELSAFLRGSTTMLERDEVPLGTEVETVRQYLHIMQARLGQRLRFSITLDAACADVPLPPGLLLTLVENAVEHGLAPTLAGGTLRVQAGREGSSVVVRVADDGAGLGPAWQEGTGLANSRARLQHVGNGRGRLELRPLEPGTEAVLSLPLDGATAVSGPASAPAADADAQDTRP